MVNPKVLIEWTKILLAYLLLSCFSTQVLADQRQEAKKLYVAVITIACLDPEEQKPHIEQLYKDYLPRLRQMRAVGIPLPGPDRPPNSETLSPEEWAEYLLNHKRGGWSWVAHTAKAVSLNVLRENRAQLVPLLKVDLTSRQHSRKLRALLTAEELEIAEVFEPVLHIFKTDAKLSERAAYTLGRLGNPRAIGPMVAKHPDLKTGMIFEELRELQVGHKADPALVQRLEDDDPDVRWRAAYALAPSGDEALVPYIRRLANDKDDRVRKHGASMAFSMKGEAFQTVRPILVSLLHDPSTDVKVHVAIVFAWRKDAVCARTLLELLKDPAVEERAHSNVVQAVNNLTGSYFGYHIGSDAREPTTENNKQAIQRFAEWIEKTGADK